MSDYFSKSFARVSAMALYGAGAFLGIAGGALVVVLGGIAIICGTDLVHQILFAAGIGAIGLTIGDYGRKKLHTLQKAEPRYRHATTIKHAG